MVSVVLMRVTGFSFIRNAVKYDFPVVEAILSVLPICDDFIVAVGQSDDDTLEMIKNINPDKIKIVIGKWWETIDKIIAATWVKIDFEDDGTCMITSKDREATQQAIDMIQKLVFEPKIWDEFLGKITRIESYGMFVKFGEKSGLVWLKTLWANFGPDLKKHFQEWQEIKVKLMKIADGKYDLMKI